MGANLLPKDSNGSKWRIKFHSIQVIATDHTDFCRNLNIEITQRLVYTLRTRISAGENRGHGFSSRKYRFGAKVTDVFLFLKIESSQPRRQPGLFHRTAVPFVGSGEPGEFAIPHKPNVPMPDGKKMARHFVSAL